MKKIRSTFFAALVMGVLCAGTVSARQLRNGPKALLPAAAAAALTNLAPRVASASSPWSQAVRLFVASIPGTFLSK